MRVTSSPTVEVARQQALLAQKLPPAEPRGSTQAQVSKAPLFQDGFAPATKTSAGASASTRAAAVKGDLVPHGNALDPRNHALMRSKANTPEGKQIIAMADRYLKSSPDPIRGIFKPEPFYLPGKDGVKNPNRDMTQIRQLNRFTEQMNSLTHAYAMTGDKKYADKAISIVDAWARTTTPGFGSGQAGISSYHPLASVFTSMKALKDYPGWKPESKAKVMDWVATYGQRALFRGDKYNNRHDWRMLFIASTASLTGNKVLFQKQVSEWKDAVAHTIRASDGMLPEELKRTRSLHYSVYALKPLTAFAELARSEGVDLYGSREGQLLRKSLEAVGPSLLNPSQWKYKELNKKEDFGAEDLFQLAAQRFGSSALRSVADGLQAKLEKDAHWREKRVLAQMKDGSSAGFPLPNLMLFG
jgi:hypothetical protein